MSIRKLMLHGAVAVCLLILGGAAGAFAQPQSKDQQGCLNTINKDGVNVAKTQGKEFLGCLKNKGKGKLVGSAQDCLTADPKDKVQKKRDKTVADEIKKCVAVPNFGYAGATAVNDAAVQADLDLVEDVFGADLDPVVIDCDASKDGCKCQQQVAKAVEKQAQTKLKLFLKCKKAVLKNGASASADLADCINDPGTPESLAADTKEKIAKGVLKIEKTVTKKCDEKGVTAGAFPGDCTGLSGAALAACLDVLVECRVCQMLNEMDALFVNCDLFDDGVANGSCDSGTGPTPTPTATPTPTTTPMPTFVPGTIFQGALPKVSGLWNFGGVNGQPGGEAECNNQFAGSHVCSITELNTAAGLGELALAHDVNSQTVTSFWVVDAGAIGNDQCVHEGGTIRWFYGTAHTPSKGRSIPLNNGAGTLGSVGPLVSCPANQHWAGCCLTP